MASAGNDGTSQPQYPAAFDGVIAVGAVGPDGPTPWTNYGDWVDACAPGADLNSSFFAKFDGPEPRVNTVDPDRFEGWATWSGTSFAAPVVVAAIAREMVLGNLRRQGGGEARRLRAGCAPDPLPGDRRQRLSGCSARRTVQDESIRSSRAMPLRCSATQA